MRNKEGIPVIVVAEVILGVVTLAILGYFGVKE